MLSTDGTEHARHREPFTHPFRPPEVRSRFEDFVEAEVERLIAAIEPSGSAELRSTVAGPLTVAVVAEALGLSNVDAATVLSWYEAIVSAVSDVTAGRPVGLAGTQAVESLRANVERAIAAEGTPSIVASAVGRLSPSEVVSNAAVLMFGGIDTTAGMITNAIRHVLSSPEARNLALGEGITNLIEESLRLEPAAAVVDRYATREISLGGATIRQGDLVVVSIAGANRDPSVFPDPNRFDPHRSNARLNLAFARGPHFCLGAPLARTETRIVLRHLLALPAVELDPNHPNAPRGLVFRRPEQLHARWEPSTKDARPT